MERYQSLAARGVIAGFAGASILALWFLVIDAARGAPFATVSYLAATVAGRDEVTFSLGWVVVFTLIHYALFMGAAALVARILDGLRTAPNMLYGFALGFVMFDAAFYVGLGRSGEAQAAASLGWPELLGGNLLAGVVIMGVLRVLAPVKYRGWWEALTGNRVIREGVVAGLLGGSIVALWFLFLDSVAGRPLFTPAALGSALFLGVGDPSQVRIEALPVLGYSLVHFGTFTVVGLVVAAIMALAEERPNVILLGGLLFITFLAFLMGALALFAEWVIGSLAWWNVAVGNLLATVGMGAFLLRAHPKIRLALGEEALTSEG